MNNQALLNSRLCDACKISDVDEILALIQAGADFEQYDEYGDYILGSAFIDPLYEAQDKHIHEAELTEKIKSIIGEMVIRGWNVEKYGAAFMQQFEFASSSPYTYDLYRFLMQFDFEKTDHLYSDLLESIGIEESHERAVLHDHARENVLYTIYEMIDAKKKHLPHQHIHLYTDAIGKRIDNILYFSDKMIYTSNDRYTEFCGDIGFVCGNELLVICESINVLFMDHRINEVPHIKLSNELEETVLGEFIADISFDHNEVRRGKTCYGQPIINIAMSNGKVIHFSHNFGDHSDGVRSRYWIT